MMNCLERTKVIRGKYVTRVVIALPVVGTEYSLFFSSVFFVFMIFFHQAAPLLLHRAALLDHHDLLDPTRNAPEKGEQ